MPEIPFLSLRAAAADKAAQTAGCQLQVFSGESCTGNAKSFSIATKILGAASAPCQEVAVTAGKGVGVGGRSGRSGRLVCSLGLWLGILTVAIVIVKHV